MILQINKRQFAQALKWNKELFSQVDQPQEAVLDAQVFKQLSRLTKNQVESLSTNKQKFTLQDFAERLATQLNSDNGNPRISEYRSLGNKFCYIFQRPPALRHLCGSFEIEETRLPKVKIPRQSRKSFAIDEGLATQTEDATTQNFETVGALTEILVESTFDQLKISYEKNDEESISYFAFVLDPESFSRSVENMFHFSFLIKEGRASFDLDENGQGLPFTRPIKQKKNLQNNKSTSKKHQAIISLTYDDWEDMIEQLEIEKAMIVHDLSSLRKERQTPSKRAKVF